MRNSEAQAREAAYNTLLELGLQPQSINAPDSLTALNKFMRQVWDLPIEWVPREEIPMVAPTDGQYSSDSPYVRESDWQYGNYDGFPAIVVVNPNNSGKIYHCFKAPDKCIHCKNHCFAQPVKTAQQAMYCKIDNMACGKRILSGCQDFISDGWKTEREICDEFDIRKGWSPKS